MRTPARAPGADLAQQLVGARQHEARRVGVAQAAAGGAVPVGDQPRRLVERRPRGSRAARPASAVGASIIALPMVARMPARSAASNSASVWCTVPMSRIGGGAAEQQLRAGQPRPTAARRARRAPPRRARPRCAASRAARGRRRGRGPGSGTCGRATAPAPASPRSRRRRRSRSRRSAACSCRRPGPARRRRRRRRRRGRGAAESTVTIVPPRNNQLSSRHHALAVTVARAVKPSGRSSARVQLAVLARGVDRA